MKIKESAEEMGSCNIIEDIFSGYFDPNAYLEDQADIDKVLEAMKTLGAYETALEESGKVEEI